MKREEKSMLSRQKIIDSARKEFAEKGYGLSSINTICADGDLSKGILYHYFKDKDELYLLCVSTCFEGLTRVLKKSHEQLSGAPEEALNQVFRDRLTYFSEHPMDQRLFCEAVIAPPERLAAQIGAIKAPFNHVNEEILTDILSRETLRGEYTLDEVIRSFREYQDFINARLRNTPGSAFEREQICQRALRILLYGVIDPKGKTEK